MIGRESLTGTWLDRSAIYHARLRGDEYIDISDFETQYEIVLHRLPCWSELSDDEWRAKCAVMVAEIEAETWAMHADRGSSPLGVAAVLSQDPHGQPRSSDRSPAPLVHAASRVAREVFKAAYQRFVEAFRAAAARLRAGDVAVEFPIYAFPPPRPFVGGRPMATSPP